MSSEASRTFHASQAIEISDLVGIKFSGQKFGTTTPRLIKVSEPDGPSTDGGRKARQNILLVPETGDAGTVVFGWLDSAQKKAELKGYVFLSQSYQQRYGSTLDLSKGEYDRLLQEMQDFLKGQMIDTRVAQAAPARSSSRSGPPPAAKTGTIPLWTLVLGLIVGLGAGYLLFGMQLMGR